MKRDVDEFDDVLQALNEWDAAPVSADFDRRLYARLQERRTMGERVRDRLDRIQWKPALPAAALVAAYALLMVSTPQDERRQTAPEQVEQALEDLEMLRQLPILEG